MTKLILHVEDEDDDVFLIQNAFTKAGVTLPVHAALLSPDVNAAPMFLGTTLTKNR